MRGLHLVATARTLFRDTQTETICGTSYAKVRCLFSWPAVRILICVVHIRIIYHITSRQTLPCNTLRNVLNRSSSHHHLDFFLSSSQILQSDEIDVVSKATEFVRLQSIDAGTGCEWVLSRVLLTRQTALHQVHGPHAREGHQDQGRIESGR